ncbi:MAG: DUF3316 domain-containing protein [Porphyromonadaceae bacterium]|nr:DUF3316 domain-containing protein [Porphyromonadaceae bacterium]
MRIKVTVILFFVFVLNLSAQVNENDKYALTNSAFTIGAGSAKILDPYLSPFNYNGLQVRAQNVSRKYFNPENNTLSYTHKGFLDLGIASHPVGSNSMLFFSTNYAFGINYHFRPIEKLMILAGGSWDINLGGKYLARNVNNPFSLDLYTNLNATAEIQYDFNLWRQNLRVQYGTQTPILGGMFVPHQGATYYEVFMLSNLTNAFHFSSLHNKIGWHQYLNIDIPTKINTIRFSIAHDYLIYGANDMVFKNNRLTFFVGSVMDLYVFSGTKRKTPSNFIKTYE